jgi:hypothetical protein
VKAQLNIKQKLVLAMTAYAVLAALAWTTLSDQPIQVFAFQLRLRTVTLALLGVFAFRTLLHFYRVRIEEADARNGRVLGSERE